MASTNQENQEDKVEKTSEFFLEEARALGFVKKAYCVNCERNPEKPSDICISKFGGYIPCYENDEYLMCDDCNIELEVLTQIYVPSLPKSVKALFPSSLQETLIVLFICTECLTPYGGELTTRIYYKEDFDKLVYKEPKQNGIEQAIFKSFPEIELTFHCSDDAMQFPSKYFSVADGNSNTDFYSCIDDLFIKPKLSLSYFGGHPYYVQSDERPGPDYKLILSLCDDENNFSLMWGDAGTAQIWLRNDDSNEFYITWACC